jgi:AcrR family transcriptional regulator
MSRRARLRENREEILSAAAALFAAHGYHGLSMRDLARATSQSLANLYNYFASKEDLLFAIQSRAFEILIASAEQAARRAAEAGSGAGAEGALYAFLYNHVRYVAAHRDVMRVLIEEAGRLPARRRHVMRELKERYFRMGLRHLRSLVDEKGAAPKPSAPELERATYNVFGMLNWVYGWYHPARHGSPEDVARSIHGLVLSGLVAKAPSRKRQRDTERRVAGREAVPPLSLVAEGGAS